MSEGEAKSSALEALLGRVREVKRLDREIDEDVWALHNERPKLGEYYGWERWGPGSFRRPTNSEGSQFESLTVPAYTASLDACIALAERVLPRWFLSKLGEDVKQITYRYDEHEPLGTFFCGLQYRKGGRLTVERGPTPALALLAAILSALITQGQGK